MEPERIRKQNKTSSITQQTVIKTKSQSKKQ